MYQSPSTSFLIFFFLHPVSGAAAHTRAVAALLHMPQPQYNRYEQGLRDLPTTTLIALADIYHTSTDYLLGRTNDPKPPVSL